VPTLILNQLKCRKNNKRNQNEKQLPSKNFIRSENEEIAGDICANKFGFPTSAIHTRRVFRFRHLLKTNRIDSQKQNHFNLEKPTNSGHRPVWLETRAFHRTRERNLRLLLIVEYQHEQNLHSLSC
jgi:hypothetical protein